MTPARLLSEARKAVAAFSAGVAAASAAGVLSHSLAVLLAGYAVAVGAALATYSSKANVPKGG